MKKIIVAFLFIFAICTSSIFATSAETRTAIAEDTPDSTLFRIYLDTLKYYTYINREVVHEYMDKCDEMILKGVPLSNRLRFQFAIEQIYFKSTEGDILAAYQVIKDHKRLSKLDDVPVELKNNFDYLEGYTQMMLGDYEFAQKTYYRLLERGRARKDTAIIFQSMYSLGQLFAKQQDYAKAEATYLEVLKLCGNNPEKAPRATQTLLELVSLYIETEEYSNATLYNEQALQLTEEFNIVDLRVDFLQRKGLIALEQKDFKIAWAAYLEARELAKSLENPLLERNGELLKAKIYHAEGLPERALTIYEFYLAKDTKADFLYTQDLLTDLHEVCSQLGDYTQAYHYLGALTKLKEEITAEKKMKQMAYLQAKFEVEEKDKENVLLAGEVKNKENQQAFLFGLIALFVLSICFLIIAFFQKRKYSRRLKAEVISRTRELEHSNRELDEFNRILSHDLREPLRSIVGFSTLASKEVFGNTQAMEYLGYIEKSGRQLHQIIEDVSTYQSIDSYGESPPEWVNINELLDFIGQSEEFQLAGKTLHLEKVNLRPIHAKRSFVYLIFKNLLENGMKYNRHSEVEIRVVYEKKGGQHVFTVGDNGIGIAEEYHEQIFQMFKRLNDRKAYEGSGLGLSIVEKMVDKLGGSIRLLDSQEGRGSTFELALPVAAIEETWTKKRQMASSMG